MRAAQLTTWEKIHILFFTISYNNLWLNSDPQSVWCSDKVDAILSVDLWEKFISNSSMLFIYLDKLVLTQLFPNLQQDFTNVITKLSHVPSQLSICSDCTANSTGNEQQMFPVDWDDVKLLTYLKWKLCHQPKWCWLLKAVILLILLCRKQHGLWG